jgi:hypothetical protein
MFIKSRDSALSILEFLFYKLNSKSDPKFALIKRKEKPNTINGARGSVVG